MERVKANMSTSENLEILRMSTGRMSQHTILVKTMDYLLPTWYYAVTQPRSFMMSAMRVSLAFVFFPFS